MNLKKYLLYPSLMLSLIATAAYASTAPLIYLIATPRSITTAFTRMVEARGDCTVLHEPGVDTYTLLYEPEAGSIILMDDDPKSFEQAQQGILDAVETGKPVFVKEMGFAAQHYLFTDKLASVSRKQARVMFLVRDPHASLVSLYRKRPAIYPVLDDWVDYKKLWELFELVQQQATNKPLIVISEQFLDDPYNGALQFCAWSGLPFCSEQLTWQPLATIEHPLNSEIGRLWCDTLLPTSGFITPNTYAVDATGKPTLISRITNAL